MAKTPAKAERRDAVLSFLVKPSVKQALAELAATERRSVSVMAEMLLEEALKSKGVLK